MAVAIFPVNALEALLLGSQAMKKFSPDKVACVNVLEAVAIPLACYTNRQLQNLHLLLLQSWTIHYLAHINWNSNYRLIALSAQ